MSKKYIIITFCISILLSLFAVFQLFQKDFFITKNAELVGVYEDVEEDGGMINVNLNIEAVYDSQRYLPLSTETCFVIKNFKSNYYKDPLIQEFFRNPDISNFETALYLGMFHADMTYLTAFGKQEIVPYFEQVKQLERKLWQLGDSVLYFNENKMPISVFTDFDSLLIQNIVDIENIKEYLITIKKAHLNILISTGSLIESLYVACKTFEKSPRKELKNWIALQARILDQHLLVLSFYSYYYEGQFPRIKALEDDLHILKEVYDNEVKFEYTYQEEIKPAIEENGILVQRDAYTFEEVYISNQSLEKITQTITEIRNKMLFR